MCQAGAILKIFNNQYGTDSNQLKWFLVRRTWQGTGLPLVQTRYILGRPNAGGGKKGTGTTRKRDYGRSVGFENSDLILAGSQATKSGPNQTKPRGRAEAKGKGIEVL